MQTRQHAEGTLQINHGEDDKTNIHGNGTILVISYCGCDYYYYYYYLWDKTVVFCAKNADDVFTSCNSKQTKSEIH
jgi:hypothetical protein